MISYDFLWFPMISYAFRNQEAYVSQIKELNIPGWLTRTWQNNTFNIPENIQTYCRKIARRHAAELQQDHPLRLRDHPSPVQGWESVCWGVLGAPYLKIFRFSGLSRFHHCKIPFFHQKRWGKPIDLDPRKIQTYSSQSLYLFDICLYYSGLLIF